MIASATITTNAVIEAVNSLAGAAEEAPAEEPADATGEQKSATAKGFGDGDVTVTVTLDGSTITAIDIDAESQTPGLGQNAMQDAFKNQFIGKTIPVDTAEIDVIASATITTNAVIEAINSLAGVAEETPAEEPVEEPAKPELTGITRTATATAKGYEDGDVTVTVTFDGSLITAIDIDATSQTPGMGRNAMLDEFKDQFIGMLAPIDISDIDALTWSTITTKAVIDAINSAAEAEAKESPAEAPAEEPAQPELTGISRTETATAKGYEDGDVTVTVTFDGSYITAIDIDATSQTPGMGRNAMLDEFKDQFIGMLAPIDISDIDALTWSTVTTKAVINAINSAAEAEAAEEPAEAAEEANEEAAPAAGTRTATVKGFGDGEITVTLTLDGDTITAIEIDASSQTPGLGQKAMEEAFTSQFIGKTLPVDAGAIDAITAATITTNAVIEAVNSLSK